MVQCVSDMGSFCAHPKLKTIRFALGPIKTGRFALGPKNVHQPWALALSLSPLYTHGAYSSLSILAQRVQSGITQIQHTAQELWSKVRCTDTAQDTQSGVPLIRPTALPLQVRAPTPPVRSWLPPLSTPSRRVRSRCPVVCPRRTSLVSACQHVGVLTPIRQNLTELDTSVTPCDTLDDTSVTPP